jgi:ribokinase
VVSAIGADGAMLVTPGEVRRFDAAGVDAVIDTTGAGDAFTGALAAALAHGRSASDAVKPGLLAAAKVVSMRSAHGATDAAMECGDLG